MSLLSFHEDVHGGVEDEDEDVEHIPTLVS